MQKHHKRAASNPVARSHARSISTASRRTVKATKTTKTIVSKSKRQMSTLPDITIPQNITDAITSGHLSQDIVTQQHKKAQEYVNTINKYATEQSSLNTKHLRTLMGIARSMDIHDLLQAATGLSNHNATWSSISINTPLNNDKQPTLHAKGIHDFGGIERGINEFIEKAKNADHNLDGWVSLVLDSRSKRMQVKDYIDAESPELNGYTPIIMINTYSSINKEQRDQYIDVFMNNIVNWDHAETVLNYGLQQPQTPVQFSPQITPNEMEQFKKAGFKSIINNRPDLEGGESQPLSKDIEIAANNAGIVYKHLPVIPGQVTEQDLYNFAELWNEVPKPALMFCRTGIRSNNLYNLAKKKGLVPM